MDGSSSPHTDVEERTHVAPPGSESPDMSGKQYAVYKNDAYKPALLRRLSCDTAIRPVQRSPYHQVSVAQKHPTTVAHVRQIGGGYDRGKVKLKVTDQLLFWLDYAYSLRIMSNYRAVSAVENDITVFTRSLPF